MQIGPVILMTITYISLIGFNKIIVVNEGVGGHVEWPRTCLRT